VASYTSNVVAQRFFIDGSHFQGSDEDGGAIGFFPKMYCRLGHWMRWKFRKGELARPTGRTIVHQDHQILAKR